MSNEPNIDNQVKTLEVEAPIVAVTVYTDRAQITRRGRVTLDVVGLQELVIGGLPANLDPNSLRAAGRGVQGVTIVAVESKERHLPETPHRNARELLEQLQALEDEDKVLERKDVALGQRLDVVQKLADNAAERYARALSTGAASLEAVGQLLDFVSAQIAQVQEERTGLEHQRRENSKRQQSLNSQIKQLQGARTRRDHCVTVAIEASHAGEFELEVLYVVPGASWQPLYDARLSYLENASPVNKPAGVAPEATLALLYLASLTQNTGEDWTDVLLTLSTAQPNLGSLPPKLEPIYVDVARPRISPAPMMAASVAAPGMVRRRAAAAEESDEDEGVAELLSSLEPVAEVAQAEVETKGATVTFNLPRSMSVPADGQPHRSLIALREFPCRLDYRAVPERTELGYLRASVTNDSELSLLPGSVNIFRDGVFIGSSNLEAIAPGQEFKLFLGPDEQVRAKRELTRRDVDKNFMGSVRRHTYAHVIKLENLKPHRVSLTVLDQIPVSRHEQIKVKLRHAEPAPQTDDLGELRWELVMAPESKQELSYEYTVESPRDMVLSGLDE